MEISFLNKSFVLVTAIAGLTLLPPGLRASSCLSGLAYSCTTINDQADNNPPATPTGETFTQLLGINDTGMVVGYYGSGMDPNHPNRAFSVQNIFASAPLRFIPENPPGSQQTQMFGITNDGNTMVGFYQTDDIQHGLIGILGGTSFIGPIDDTPGGVAQPVNQLLGVNDHNQAAGFYQDNSGIFHAYTVSNLTTGANFTPIGPANSQATGINNSGEVTGFTFTNAADTTANGFLINGSTTTTLQFPGSTFTQAFGLNNSGAVVGDFTDAAGVLHGFIYYINSGTYDELDPAGSVGTTLNGINDQGDIVGFFMDGGTGADGIANTDGLLATPVPEPASVGLMGLACLGLGLAYRRKRHKRESGTRRGDILSATHAKRQAILMTMLCAFAYAASASTVYTVSGSLGNGGLLSGESFSGTFIANLPVTGGGEFINTFNIDLYAPGSVVPDFAYTGSKPGDIAEVTVESGCGLTATTTGPCDEFDFLFLEPNGAPVNGLQLITPTGFAGGAVAPFFTPPGAHVESFALAASGYVTPVASGRIDAPVPEPASAGLFGLAAISLGLTLRSKRFKK